MYFDINCIFTNDTTICIFQSTKVYIIAIEVIKVNIRFDIISIKGESMLKQMFIISIIVIMTSCSAICSKANKISFDLEASPKSYAVAKKRSLIWTFGPILAGSTVLLINNSRSNTSQGLNIAGGTIGVLGILVGPRTGLAYAGKRRPYNSTFNRIGLAAAGFAGSIAAYFAFGGEINIFGQSEPNPTADAAAIVVFTATGLFIIKNIISDFTKLEKQVDEYNKKYKFTSLSLEPTYYPKTKSYGLSMRLSF